MRERKIQIKALLIFSVFLLIFFINPFSLCVDKASAYGGDAHAHIGLMAHLLWPGPGTHEINNYLHIEPDNTDYFIKSTTGDDIYEGEREEDEYDPIADRHVWDEGGLTIFYSHFWDCDNPDLLSSGFDPLLGEPYPSALHDALYYWNQFVLPYYLGLNGLSVDKGKAYYYLGRIAHLLQDMSVPAHVHLLPHPGGDPYEDYINSNYSLFSANGEPVFFNNIENLFYNLAQRTQYFPSPSGSNLYSDVEGNTINAEATWFDGWPTVDVPLNNEELSLMANKLMPLAYQYTAGLYKLFWNTTHSPQLSSSQISINQQSVNFYINYTDTTQKPPSYIRLVLNPGGTFTMDEAVSNDNNYADGKVYFVSVTLQPGNYQYHYEASNALNTAREPETDEHSLTITVTPSIENCTDGIDNDGDQLADCNDPDCYNDASCILPENCSDGIDNDRDGLIDCNDLDCFNDLNCILYDLSIAPQELNFGNLYQNAWRVEDVELYNNSPVSLNWSATITQGSSWIEFAENSSGSLLPRHYGALSMGIRTNGLIAGQYHYGNVRIFYGTQYINIPIQVYVVNNQDAYENNDTEETAAVISLNSSIMATLYPCNKVGTTSDIDWYSINIPQKGLMRAHIENSGVVNSSYIEYQNGSGEFFGFGNNYTGDIFNGTADPGTYLIRLRDTSNDECYHNPYAFTVNFKTYTAPHLNKLGVFNITGNYEVSWIGLEWASAYVLEEDTDVSFSNPSIVYYGTDTYVNYYNKEYGTHCYRLKAVYPSSNFGDGGETDWSNCECITVYPNEDRIIITSGPSSTPESVKPTEEIQLTLNAVDLFGHKLNYLWSANGGSFDDTTEKNPVWIAPEENGNYTINVTVSCTEGLSINASVQINVSGDIYYVSQFSGNDETGDGSKLNPWQSIQHAVNQFGWANDATLLVSMGSYYGVQLPEGLLLKGGYNTKWERWAFSNYGIEVPDDYKTTIIGTLYATVNMVDGFIINGSGERAVHVSSGEMHGNFKISNCIITGGYHWNEQYDAGGGMRIADCRNALITNCIIKGNSSSYGGGIYCSSSSPTIANCVITQNSAAFNGGGIYSDSGSNPTIKRCIISNNSAGPGEGADGGGVYSSSLTVTNSFIINNKINGGSGVSGIRCGYNAKIISSTIADNKTEGPGAGYGIYIGEFNDEVMPIIKNSILWNNLPEEINGERTQVTYSCVMNGWEGEGNISADPMFVNPIAGNYHLSPNSPCIDTGTNLDAPLDDFDGDTRPLFNGYDIGADELSELVIISGPSGTPNPAAKGQTVQCNIEVYDCFSHNITYVWSADAGSFDEPNKQNPVWTAPCVTSDIYIKIRVEITCSEGKSTTKSFLQNVKNANVLITPITSIYDGYLDAPSISVNGSKIAFVSGTDLLLYSEMLGINLIANSNNYILSSISGDGNKIAFTSSADLVGSNPDGNQELFLYSDETGIIQITNYLENTWFDDISINADGSKTVFKSYGDLAGTNSDGSEEIFMYLEGVGITQITNSMASSFQPSVNSDGGKIAFTSCADLVGLNPDESCEIFLFTEGVGITQITNSTASSHDPVISADGRKIAFISNDEIFLFTAGVGITQITNSGVVLNDVPSISANGDKIVFTSSADLVGSNPNRNEEVFLYSEGSGIIQITNSGNDFNSYPKISADGKRIVFINNTDTGMSNLMTATFISSGCDSDMDDDGTRDTEDNCPNKPNGPNLGTCSSTSDKPGINCTSDADCANGCSSNGLCIKDQRDTDNDGKGDVCDNCLTNCNSQQLDSNHNGIGDVCDQDPGCGGCNQPQCENQC